MDKKIQQELEAKGWMITTPEEFLELTPEETAYIEVKLLLSQNLRERREKLTLPQQALANMLVSSQPRVSKMETGDPAASLDLQVRFLLHIGMTPTELGDMFAAKT